MKRKRKCVSNAVLLEAIAAILEGSQYQIDQYAAIHKLMCQAGLIKQGK